MLLWDLHLKNGEIRFMNKTLILGGSGLIGKSIINEMSKLNNFQIYSTYYNNILQVNNCESFKFDIQDLNNMDKILKKLQPQIVISCLRGKFDKQLTLHTKVAEYLKENGGRLYFFSTTNVFDNDFSRPHYEDDLPNSCTDYGQYKVKCEEKITEILKEYASILRIPQVWGKDSPRMKQVIELLTTNKKVIVYPKLFLNSNTDIMIAKQTAYIINNNLRGIFHLAAGDIINSKDFYFELIKELGFNNAALEENFEEKGYFALLSKRSNELPKDLRLINESVIKYLTT